MRLPRIDYEGEIYQAGPYTVAAQRGDVWVPPDYLPDQEGADHGEGCWRDVSGRSCDRQPDPESVTGMCARHAGELLKGD